MRVLHLTSTFPRFQGDVSGTFLADLLAAERRSGVEVAVVAPHDGDLPAEDIIDGVAVRRFRYGPVRLETLAYRGGLLAAVGSPASLAMVPSYLLGMLVSVVSIGRRDRSTIIHAHWWFPGGVVGLVAARLLGIHYVVTLHGSDVHLLRRRSLRWLARRVIGGAAAVTAVSETLAQEATRLLALPSGRVRVLPMPVVLAERTAVVTRAPQLPTPLRLLAVGRLAPEKGFHILVQAAGRLIAEGRAVELQIAGEGPERDRLQRDGVPLGTHLALLGACPRPEVERLMEAAHAVVVPSTREGLGLVAVEALALGCPVVASDVGGLPEVVESGVDGILVPPGDVEALAAALRQLPLPPPRAAAVARYRPVVVGESYRALYADVLTGRSSRTTGAGRSARAGGPDPAGPGPSGDGTRAAAPRWRPMRWFGVLAALAMVAVLARIGLHDWPAIRRAWLHPNRAAFSMAVALTLLSEVGFGLASSVALTAIHGPAVPTRRVAAAFWVSQTAKNIPGGVWTTVARAGVADGWGVPPRATVRWMATEAVASCAAGGTVGGAGLALAAQLHGHAGRAALWTMVAALSALSPLSLTRGFPIARLLSRLTGEAPTPAGAARAGIAYLPVWLIGAAAFAALCRTVVGLSGSDLVLAGAASCIASIAGFLAVPVPSGLGVREAILVALLATVMPTAVAASVVLASRALAIAAQSGLALVGLPLVRGRRRLDGAEV